MKKNILIYIGFIATLFPVASFAAGGITMTISGGDAVTVGTAHYVQGTATATYDLSFTAGEKDTVVSATVTYTWNGQTKVVDNPTISINKITDQQVYSNLSAATSAYVLKAEVKYTLKNQEEKSVSYSSDELYVYTKGSASLTTNPSNLIFMEKSDALTWAFTSKDGYDKGWQYAITIDDSAPNYGTSATITCPAQTNSSTAKTTASIKLHARNIAPDGRTVWATFTEEQKLEIYPKCDVSDITSSFNIALFANERISTRAYPTGGYAGGWSYIWDGDDKVSMQERTFSADKNISTATTTEHKLTVRNTATLSDGSKKEWYTNNYTYDVKFWPVPSADWESSYPTDVVEGDTVNFGTMVSGGDNNKWEYSWNNGSPGNDVTFSYIPVYSKDKTQETIQVNVTNKPENIQTGFSKTLTHNVRVWEKPQVSPDSDSIIETYGGRKETMRITRSGGKNANWRNIWTCNGEKLAETGDAISTGELENPKIGTTDTLVYKVNTTYTSEGGYKLDSTFTFTIVVCPKPVAEVVSCDTKDIEDFYCDETRTLGFRKSGGFNTKPGEKDWQYIWTIGNDTLMTASEEDTTYVYSYPNPETLSKCYSGRIKVKIAYIHNSKKLYTDDFYYPINVWPRGKFDASSNTGSKDNPIDVRDGDNMNFSIAQVGGYTGSKGGWVYNFSKDGVIDEPDASSYPSGLSAEYNSTEDGSYKDHTYVLSAQNHIGDIWDTRYTPTFYYRVWPKAVFKDYVAVDINTGRTLEDGDGVREGNVINFDVSKITCGYNPDMANNNYRYVWTGDYAASSTTPDDFSQTMSMPEGNTMLQKSLTYTLTEQNLGPDNQEWYRNSYTRNFIIYRKPLTPKSLTKKGSGASGTMIATTSITDQDLQDRKYYLVFGYEDTNGNEKKSYLEVQNGAGDTRFESQFTSDEVNKSSYKFFVYALWEYEDGAQITSGKRYVNAVDESWDGSTYGSRGVIDPDATAINQVTEQEGEASAIYTLDGKQTSRLAKGLNIVKMSDGQVKKIMVK